MRAGYNEGDAVLFTRSFNTITNGDIVYFQYPLLDSIAVPAMLIQRVVAAPGDTLEIKNDSVYVNQKLLQLDAVLQYNYFVKTNCTIDSLSLQQLGLTEGGRVSDENDYSFSLTDSQVVQLRRMPDVSKVELRTEKPGAYDENCFPFKSTFAWNNHFYGKLYVPKRGDTLQIDTANLALYQLLITQHEKNKVELQGDSIFINGTYSNTYVVKKDYYFVLGDNRSNANDSRNWGYLPANLIKGEVRWILRKKKKH